MDRRTLLKGSAALVGAAALPTVPAQAQSAPEKLRFGYAITQSGPLGPGAESTVVSQYKLWHKRVNDAGGIMLKKFGKKVPVEMIGYDDQGKPDELLKLTSRLIEQDKVDMLLSPYATHMNLASAPIANKYGYPVVYPTATTTKTYDLAKKLPFAFWQIAQPNEATGPLAEYIAGLKKEGKLKGRVATMHPAIEYGVEMNTAFLNAAKREGIEVVTTKTYPFGASDLQPVIREMMGTKPDAVLAFSYPPDTFMLTEQMRIIGFNPDLMYVAIGGVFPTYKGKFGDKVNGILAYGGQDTSVEGYAEYDKAHRAMHNRPSEAGALSAYSAIEVVQQAMEEVGEVDRQKIRDLIASGKKFKTIWGELHYVDQRCANPWAVGQWQNGEMVGVFPTDKAGAKPVQFPKPKWS
jgi:branched-chain amino acid transport system substrate-binding protein